MNVTAKSQMFWDIITLSLSLFHTLWGVFPAVPSISAGRLERLARNARKYFQCWSWPFCFLQQFLLIFSDIHFGYRGRMSNHYFRTDPILIASNHSTPKFDWGKIEKQSFIDFFMSFLKNYFSFTFHPISGSLKCNGSLCHWLGLSHRAILRRCSKFQMHVRWSIHFVLSSLTS